MQHTIEVGNQFNLEHKGEIHIEQPEFGQYFLGDLSLSVKMNGYVAVPVKYEYEKK